MQTNALPSSRLQRARHSRSLGLTTRPRRYASIGVCPKLQHLSHIQHTVGIPHRVIAAQAKRQKQQFVQETSAGSHVASPPPPTAAVKLWMAAKLAAIALLALAALTLLRTFMGWLFGRRTTAVAVSSTDELDVDAFAALALDDAAGAGGNVSVVNNRAVQVSKDEYLAAVGRAKKHKEDLARVQAQVQEVQQAAKLMQTKLMQQLKDREEDLTRALQTASNLERELEAVGAAMRSREAELASVQAAAAAAAEQSSAALDESQRRTALLEAMVVTLRDKLNEEEDKNATLQAELCANQLELKALEGQRQELLSQVEVLRSRLEATQSELAAAEARAASLEERMAALTRYNLELEAKVVALEAQVATQAQTAQAAALAAEQCLQAVQQQADDSRNGVLELQRTVDAKEADLLQLEEALQQSYLEKERAEALLRQLQQGRGLEITQLQERKEQALQDLKRRCELKDQELMLARQQLDAAVVQADAEEPRRQQELGQLAAGLELQLATAKAEAEASRQQLVDVKQEMRSAVESALLELAEQTEAETRAASPSSTSAGAPTSWRPQSRADAAVAAASEGEVEVVQQIAELRSRATKLQGRIDHRRNEIDLLVRLVHSRLSNEMQKKVAAVEASIQGAAAALQAVLLRPREVTADGRPSTAETRGRRELQQYQQELQLLYRSQMGLETRQRERNLRIEITDMEAELSSINAQLTQLQQILQPPSASAGLQSQGAAAATSSPTEESELSAAVKSGMKEILKQRQQQLGILLEQRDIEHQARLQQLQQDHGAQLQAAEQQVQVRIQQLESQWRAQMDTSTSGIPQSPAGATAAAATTDVSMAAVRQQLLELRGVQEDMGVTETVLQRLREGYDQRFEGLQGEVTAAQSEVSNLTGQLQQLKGQLGSRRSDIKQLRDASNNTAISKAAQLMEDTDERQLTRMATAALAPPPPAVVAPQLPESPATESQSLPRAMEEQPPPPIAGSQPSETVAAGATAAVEAAPAAGATSTVDRAAGAAEAEPAPLPLPTPSSVAEAASVERASAAPLLSLPQQQEAAAAAEVETRPEVTASATDVPTTAESATDAPETAASTASSTRAAPEPAPVPSSQWGGDRASDSGNGTGNGNGVSNGKPSSSGSGTLSGPSNTATVVDNGRSPPGAGPSTSAPPATAAPATARPSDPSPFPSEADMGQEVLQYAQNVLLRSGSATATTTAPLRARPTAPARAAAPTKLLRIICAGSTVPHEDKVETGGEDAFFVTTAGCGAFGVADGVGGWVENGVNAADYARTLMVQSVEAVDSTQGQDGAAEVLDYAQASTHMPGSATACIGVLKPGGILDIACIGDSGIRVLRNGAVVFATGVQEHMYNMPYQLACPEFLPETDTVSDAQLLKFQLQPGDIVISGSDGLFDNMWDSELVQLVQAKLATAATPGFDRTLAARLAKAIANTAHTNAADRNYRSPWVVEAAELGHLSLFARMFPRGGKMDDITVVVALAHEP